MNAYKKALIIIASILVVGIVFETCNLKSNANNQSDSVTKINVADIKNELLKIDKEFSDYSQKHGMQKAFLHYVADDGVRLLPKKKPIEGKAAIAKGFEGKNDTSFELTWEPTFSDISESGDLGYTYGIWTLTFKNPTDNPQKKGTYTTIWKKQKDGTWKWVLDSGNEGLH